MSEQKKSNGGSSQNVTFHYLKSTQYRVVHVDGAIGGPTSTGLIHIAMYSEHSAIPREQVFSLTKDGTLGDLVQTVSRGGVVRELEVDAMMTLDYAKSLRDWLINQINKLEKSSKKG